jgi:hypothetical protein
MPTSDPYLAALTRLADHLRTTTSFESAFDLFEGGLASDPRFIAACEVTRADAFLDASLAHCATRYVGAGARWTWITPLMRYAAARFLHGAALVGGRPAMLFYFEEHELGLACIMGKGTHYIRLAKLALPKGTVVGRDRGRA